MENRIKLGLVDQALLGTVAEEYAAENYDGHFEFGPERAARYTAEKYCKPLREKYGTEVISNAMAEYIHAHPEVLTRSRADRIERRTRRIAEGQALVEQADKASATGDHQRAHLLLEDAQMLIPDYDVDRYRAEIDQTEAAALATVR
ncbi:hypothetical protein [Nocardia sp. CA-120079]|uniref:hypothetical protein n=1 Tax=Nocardia sp. CA-120079 TaxID=3239974 RepID=UPI003D960A04